MAGMGPPPKDPNKRARGARGDTLRVIETTPTAQPELDPDTDWHPRTCEWWAMWGRSPLAREFTENDWSELHDTALIHTRLWRGEGSAASELRLRVAAFGATPADRARLRITFAQADAAESKPPSASSSRERRGTLKATG